MALELLTAGVSIKYAVESTAGTRPTSGYTAIPNVVSINNLAGEQTSHDVTDLSDTDHKRYILGLFDNGGNVSLNVNVTAAFVTAWEALVTAAATAAASSKKTWYAVQIPGVAKAFYFSGRPGKFMPGDIETDAVFTATVNIAPEEYDDWDTAPST